MLTLLNKLLGPGISRLLLISLLLPAYTSFALPEDSQQPIYITSNSAVKDEKLGYTIYEGNVDIQQGSLQIQGDKITVYLKQEQVTRIIATGNPAKFQQQPKPNKGDVVATAKTIDYLVGKKVIDLTDQASLNQDGSITEANKIHYDITASRIEAGSNKGRVNMVLQPQQTEPTLPSPVQQQ